MGRLPQQPSGRAPPPPGALHPGRGRLWRRGDSEQAARGQATLRNARGMARHPHYRATAPLEFQFR
eukprot:9083486-Alexandrium_andersonii.AAC.1